MYNLMVYFVLAIFWLSAIGMALSDNALIQNISHVTFMITAPLATLGIIREVIDNNKSKQ